jgi:ubiquinone/menaquinone biosynthesis C-methylase UbiE
MNGVADNAFDFVHTSHCLEHMQNPVVALNSWLRILKPGGHMICLVPDEDLYEQGEFPSSINPEHNYSFTIYKKNSWSKYSINLLDLLANAGHPIEIKKIELLDATFRYDYSRFIQKPRFDQTMTPIGECAIEFILKKLAA